MKTAISCHYSVCFIVVPPSFRDIEMSIKLCHLLDKCRVTRHTCQNGVYRCYGHGIIVNHSSHPGEIFSGDGQIAVNLLVCGPIVEDKLLLV